MDHLIFDWGVGQLRKTILAQEKQKKKITHNKPKKEKNQAKSEKKWTNARQKKFKLRKLPIPLPTQKLNGLSLIRCFSIIYFLSNKNDIVTTGQNQFG